MEARVCRRNREVIAAETWKLDWLHWIAGQQGDCDATGWVGARHRPRRSRVSGHGGAAAEPGQSTLQPWPPNAMRLRRNGLTTDVISAWGRLQARTSRQHVDTSYLSTSDQATWSRPVGSQELVQLPLKGREIW
jgi:hypothetical protein